MKPIKSCLYLHEDIEEKKIKMLDSLLQEAKKKVCCYCLKGSKTDLK